MREVKQNDKLGKMVIADISGCLPEKNAPVYCKGRIVETFFMHKDVQRIGEERTFEVHAMLYLDNGCEEYELLPQNVLQVCDSCTMYKEDGQFHGCSFDANDRCLFI